MMVSPQLFVETRQRESARSRVGACRQDDRKRLRMDFSGELSRYSRNVPRNKEKCLETKRGAKKQKPPNKKQMTPCIIISGAFVT
jgi:hypothetical protein